MTELAGHAIDTGYDGQRSLYHCNGRSYKNNASSRYKGLFLGGIVNRSESGGPWNCGNQPRKMCNMQVVLIHRDIMCHNKDSSRPAGILLWNNVLLGIQEEYKKAENNSRLYLY
jgi:hypothetical protein